MSDSGTPWTIAHEASLSVGFSRQEHRSGLPFPSPGDLTDSGIDPMSPALAGRFLPLHPLGSPSDGMRCECILQGGLCHQERRALGSWRKLGCWVPLIQTDGLWLCVFHTTHMCNPDFSPSPNLHQGGERPKISLPVSLYLLSQVCLSLHPCPHHTGGPGALPPSRSFPGHLTPSLCVPHLEIKQR